MKTKVEKILLLVVVLGLLVLVGGYAGYRGYKSLRQARLVKQAREYLVKQDQRKALLSLQRALRYNSRDVDACRLMAQLAEEGRSPAALIWRSKVVELNPDSLDDRLALAQTAMFARDFTATTNALEGVLPSDKKTAPYHNVAGLVSIAANQPVQAEAHFVEAVRLEPDNTFFQMNVAVIRLNSTNTTIKAGAQASLQRISANPTNGALRCKALRELATDALRHQEIDSALTLCQKLVQDTNSAFSDRLLQLDILQQTRNKQFRPTLAACQKEAGEDTKKVWELGMWQMAKTSPRETIVWLQSLSATVRNTSQVGMLTADCHAALQDWRGLQALVEPQNWAEMEFIRHAFKTLALREQKLAGAAKAEWELAFKAAELQKQSLVLLLQFAARWNWLSEGEEVLWVVVNRYPGEKWATQLLARLLLAGGRTRSMMQFYGQEAKRDPSDLLAKNNLAITALLLDAQELKPHDLAREVYQKSPTNSSFISTYAFSLHLQNRNAEALKLMEQLKPKELEDPSTAGYYGLILKATGNRAKARTYLASSASMLPEEKKLFEAAKVGL
ncbi:MAG: hypothetical protein HOP33_18800 [Verrucomicrobia bacterium]|nr:hypothetical protein [Verrucomicrobiota bacterium]